MKANKMPEQVIMGDYVFTPIKNAFNDKISIWVSKRYYAISIYCFTIYDKSDLDNLKDEKVLQSYIDLLETAVKSKKP